MAKGIKVKSDYRAAVQKFRFRSATKWGEADGTALLKNSIYQDEDPMEQQDEGQIEAAEEIERMRDETEFISETKAAREERLYILCYQ